MSNLKPHHRFYLLAAVVGALGSYASYAIYSASSEFTEDAAFYEFEHSKRYRHEMEAIGGKLNLLLSDMAKSVEGWFQGRNLAYLLAFATAVMAIVLVCVGRRMAKREKSGAEKTE